MMLFQCYACFLYIKKVLLAGHSYLLIDILCHGFHIHIISEDVDDDSVMTQKYHILHVTDGNIGDK